MSPSLFHVVTHGKVAIMAHHGHGAKFKELPSAFAENFPREFGNADYRFAYSGHYHHRREFDESGVIARQLPTLAPNDAFSSSLGKTSTRRAEVSTFHKEEGEVMITMIPANRLRKVLSA
jgi:hypothetical protein